MNKLMKLSLASLVAVSAMQINAMQWKGTYPPDKIVIENDTDLPIEGKMDNWPKTVTHNPREKNYYPVNAAEEDNSAVKIRSIKFYTQDGLLIKELEYPTWAIYPALDRRIALLMPASRFKWGPLKMSEWIKEAKEQAEQVVRDSKFPRSLGHGKLSAKL